MINEKEEEIKDIKEKYENSGDPEWKNKKTDDLNSEEVQALKEVFLSQQEEYELYRETTEKKLKGFFM